MFGVSMNKKCFEPIRLYNPMMRGEATAYDTTTYLFLLILIIADKLISSNYFKQRNSPMPRQRVPSKRKSKIVTIAPFNIRIGNRSKFFKVINVFYKTCKKT